ncbi:MAG: 7TM diverse intracellular signaling domain-containing protein [Alkalispirochaeta sp.]
MPLVGDWEIYWERLVDHDSSASPDGRFTMPGIWNDWSRNGEAVGGMGHATFAVRVLLPETMSRGALLIPPASTAYRLWGNGILLAENGVPGHSRQTTTPHYAVRRAVFESPEHVLNLTLQVANYHHRRGGMWRPIQLGTIEDITSRATMETAYDLLLVGSFLAMAVYNLVLYLIGSRKNKTPLWLSALFLVLVVRNLVMGQMMITQVFPRFPWGVQLRIEYLTSHLALLTVVLAIREAYRAYLPPWFINVVRILVGVNVVLVLLTPVLFYSQIVGWYVYLMLAALAFVAVHLIQAWIRGDRGAWPGIAAAAITFFITLNDLLLFNRAILSREFTPFGFLVPLLFADTSDHVSAYLVSTGINLVLIFAAANMIIFKSTRALVTVGRGEERAMELSLRQDCADDEADQLVKYARSGLSAGEVEQIYRSVVRYLEESAMYRDPKVSLGALAHALGVDRHHLSQVVNSKTTGNFYAFINRFRIDDFAARIERGEHDTYTLAALADACGFSSYATFFNTLKRMTGETPREYVARVEQNRRLQKNAAGPQRSSDEP